MGRQIERRAFLRGIAVGGMGLVILRDAASARSYQANEKVNVGLIGVGGRGRWFVETMPRLRPANVVAFCDVNDVKIAEAFKRYADLAGKFAASPNAWEKRVAPIYKGLAEQKVRTFHDFRKMIDAMGGGLDAVTVATPDHTHAVASAAAIRAGKHVFCEKPLTRTVGESRALRKLARKYKVATAMGNQGTYSGAFRRALELIRQGAIGEVKEVHIWNSGGGANRTKPPQGTPPVPASLKWDLWLGPAAYRPYHREWMKRNIWRDLGTCQLGNWAPHTANLAFMAMRAHDLWLEEDAAKSKPIIRVKATSSGINRLSFPKWEMVRWELPARGKLKPITFIWYNGAAPGRQEIVDRLKKEAGEPDRGNINFAGTHIVGTKGRIHSTGHNMSFRLLPEKQFQDVQRSRPEVVAASRGPEMDWLAACRGGKAPWSNFDYASALVELLMLGNVATQIEGELEFDPVACKITNNAAADALLKSEYRKGWGL